MKRLCFGVALLISTPVFAVDFESAMAAYDRQEYRTAFKSFGELAAGGDADAQFMLGRLYAAGNGVVQDYVQAHKWYNLAASQGHKQAARARDTVAKEMTAQQIADAQRLAREWQSGGAAPGASAASPSPPAATEKPTRPMIASIQRGLKTLGYPITATDGKLGPKTKSIIRHLSNRPRLDRHEPTIGDAARPYRRATGRRPGDFSPACRYPASPHTHRTVFPALSAKPLAMAARAGRRNFSRWRLHA
ncbi:MAG: tetratricopeptide repeat protein [Gammaproteobacteria bacterium]